MSIIYKALQKTQQSLLNHNNPAMVDGASRRFNWVDAILLAIIFLLLSAVTIAYYPKIKIHLPTFSFWKHPQPVVIQPKIPARLPEVDYQGDLALTGVFFSNDEKIAMIGNEQMHVGDSVRGMKILSIDQDKIKLQGTNAIYIIHTAL